jgi:REP element-mobilizing transposase RayT
MDKYQNKYRIPSARLQNWDYGENGAYFITICTKNMACYFGNVVSAPSVQTRLIASVHDNDNDSKCDMQLNELGKIAHRNWENIPNQFPCIELGNFVIMPNHMHGILIINKMKLPSDTVETRLIASLQPQNENKIGGFAGNKNPMINENISRIIRWYKGRCSFEMRKIHTDFEWLSRFHDHIIRDSKAFERIQTYIENNPSKWKEDKFHN